MQIVILVRISLNRIGSIGSGGFSSHRQAEALREIKDEETETIREAVVKFAVEQGEQEAKLSRLACANDFFHRNKQITAFDVHQLQVSYSTRYAECQVLAALKANGRYFKLDEKR